MLPLLLLIIAICNSVVNGAKLTVFKGNRVRSTSEFPFITLLRSKTSSCTGTLVAKNMVLTAAHCACMKHPIEKAYFNTKNRRLLHKETPVTLSLVHRDYESICSKLRQGGAPPTGAVTDVDMSMMFLGESVDLTADPSRVNLAKLDFSSLPYPVGTAVMAIGYGWDISEKTQYMQRGILKYGQLKTTDCCTELENGGICIQKNKSGNIQVTDVGDSGGPLLLEEKRKIAGVLSGMKQCRQNNEVIQEIVYSRIGANKFFIDQYL